MTELQSSERAANAEAANAEELSTAAEKSGEPAKPEAEKSVESAKPEAENAAESAKPEAENAAESAKPDSAEAGAASADDEDAHVSEATRIKQVSIGLLIVLLFLATAIVVISIPPVGSQPVSQSNESQFALGRKVMLLAPGDTTNARQLRYVAFSENRAYARYKLFIQESNRYESGATVRTEFRVDILMRRGISGNDRSVYISLDDGSVDVRVYDGDTLREIPDAGSMYQGIILEGRLDPVSGLSRLVPSTKINPQIARVLYIVSDVLRYAWVALPEPAIGVGGGWRMVDDTNAASGESVQVVAAVKEDHIALNLTHKAQNITDGEGNAELRFVTGEGTGTTSPGDLLSEFKGQIQSQLDHGPEGKGEHKMAFSLRFERWDEAEEK